MMVPFLCGKTRSLTLGKIIDDLERKIDFFSPWNSRPRFYFLLPITCIFFIFPETIYSQVSFFFLAKKVHPHLHSDIFVGVLGTMCKEKIRKSN